MVSVDVKQHFIFKGRWDEGGGGGGRGAGVALYSFNNCTSLVREIWVGWVWDGGGGLRVGEAY